MAAASDDSRAPENVVVIGAGPAGLTAAYALGRRGGHCIVVEADTVVGGISRTAEREGWRFDIGGHRFFTKVREVEELWHEILGPEDFLLRPRLSRIYHDGKFFDYPIQLGNAVKGLGLVESFGSTTSSSRPTPRRSGESLRRRSRLTGRRSGSRTSPSGRPC